MLNAWTKVLKDGHGVECRDYDLYHDVVCPVHPPYGTVFDLACLTMSGT